MAAAVAVCLFGGPGCRRDQTVVNRNITGISLTVNYDPQGQLTALAISVISADALAFPTDTLPRPPRALTSGRETATILLPASLEGKTVTVRVDGVAGARVAASGQQAAVAVLPMRLVDVTVTLGAPAVCGDGVVRPGIETCDDGNTVSGDGCSQLCREEAPGACNPTTCASGCCLNGFCLQPALASCGSGGLSCTVCDAALASGCSSAGACTCGTGPACETGQRCLGDVCVC